MIHSPSGQAKSPEESTIPGAGTWRSDIDGLRAVAVLMVIAFHAFPGWVSGGFVGVDIFFVISGYLITGIIHRDLDGQRFSFLQFYQRRILRIFPALLLVLGAVTVAGWILLLPDELFELGKHIFAGAGFASNIAFALEQGYFQTASELKPLLHLWSLGIEEQFYIVFPALVWLCWRSRTNTRNVLLPLALLSFFLSERWLDTQPTAAFFMPQTRMWELLCGAILALSLPGAAALRTMPRWATEALALAGLSLCGWGMAHLTEADSFPGRNALFPVVGAMLLLTTETSWINRKLLSHPVMIGIGLISYPLYLWHWPLFSFARIVHFGDPSAAVRLALVVLSFVLAWLTWALLERRMRHGSDARTKTRLLGGCMLLVGAVGFTIVLQRGVPGRFLSTQHFALGSIFSTHPLHRDVATMTPIDRYDAHFAGKPDFITALRQERRTMIRTPYCHVPNSVTASSLVPLDERCLRISATKPNILILGDSYAADLYAVLASTHADWNFLQLTSGGCAPLRAVEGATLPHRKCRQMVDYGIAFSIQHRLDAVILAARWDDSYSLVAGEIAELKRGGIRTVLAGPAYEYDVPVYQLLFRRRADETMDSLLRTRVDRGKLELNQTMQAFARDQQVSYLDRLNAFCARADYCPFLSPQGELYVDDTGHVLPSGARYLGDRLLQKHVIGDILRSPLPTALPAAVAARSVLHPEVELLRSPRPAGL